MSCKGAGQEEGKEGCLQNTEKVLLHKRTKLEILILKPWPETLQSWHKPMLSTSLLAPSVSHSDVQSSCPGSKQGANLPVPTDRPPSPAPPHCHLHAQVYCLKYCVSSPDSWNWPSAGTSGIVKKCWVLHVNHADEYFPLYFQTTSIKVLWLWAFAYKWPKPKFGEVKWRKQSWVSTIVLNVYCFCQMQ